MRMEPETSSANTYTDNVHPSLGDGPDILHSYLHTANTAFHHLKHPGTGILFRIISSSQTSHNELTGVKIDPKVLYQWRGRTTPKSVADELATGATDPMTTVGESEAVSAIESGSATEECVALVPANEETFLVHQFGHVMSVASHAAMMGAGSSFALGLAWHKLSGDVIDQEKAKRMAHDSMTSAAIAATAATTSVLLESSLSGTVVGVTLGSGLAAARECPSRKDGGACVLEKFREGVMYATAATAAGTTCAPFLGAGAVLCSTAASFFMRLAWTGHPGKNMGKRMTHFIEKELHLE